MSWSYFLPVDVPVPDFVPVDFAVEVPVFVPEFPLDALHSSLVALAAEDVFFDVLDFGEVFVPLLVEVDPPDGAAPRSLTHSATLAISASGRRLSREGMTSLGSVDLIVRRTSSAAALTLA